MASVVRKVWFARLGLIGLVWQVWFGRFCLEGLFGRLCLEILFGRFGLVDLI